MLALNCIFVVSGTVSLRSLNLDQDWTCFESSPGSDVQTHILFTHLIFVAKEHTKIMLWEDDQPNSTSTKSNNRILIAVFAVIAIIVVAGVVSTDINQVTDQNVDQYIQTAIDEDTFFSGTVTDSEISNRLCNPSTGCVIGIDFKLDGYYVSGYCTEKLFRSTQCGIHPKGG